MLGTQKKPPERPSEAPMALPMVAPGASLCSECSVPLASPWQARMRHLNDVKEKPPNADSCGRRCCWMERHSPFWTPWNTDTTNSAHLDSALEAMLHRLAALSKAPMKRAAVASGGRCWTGWPGAQVDGTPSAGHCRCSWPASSKHLPSRPPPFVSDNPFVSDTPDARARLGFTVYLPLTPSRS